MSLPQIITELYAWVCTEPDGSEGIPAVKVGNMVMPLVGADRERVESHREAAVEVANRQGFAIRLVRFSQTEIIEHISRRSDA